MKVSIERFGVIREANIDLNKPLTIFCGHNSTGKTYLSYLLYSILRYDGSQKGVSQSTLDKLLETGSVILPIDKKKIEDYIQDMQKNIKSSLPDVFGLSEEDTHRFFQDVSINIDIPTTEEIKSLSFLHKIKVNQYEFQLEKKTNEFDILVICNNIVEIADDLSSQIIKQFIANKIYSTIYQKLIQPSIERSFIMPVERNSIYTFNKELSLQRNTLIDKMQKLAKNEKITPFDFLEENTRRYPLAISTGLKIANDLNTIKKRRGDFYEIATIIENELLHGEVGTTSDGDVIFKVKKNKLPIHITSSLVKTTSSLIFYLKHLLKKGDLVIIDEPEMNLHPDSQLEWVKIIVLLINNGLRFLISTHSDYIVREINKYIMLGSINREDILEKYGNPSVLKLQDVGFYFFGNTGRDKKVSVRPINPNGENCFSIPSIDFVIEKQNKEISELYEELKYGEAE